MQRLKGIYSRLGLARVDVTETAFLADPQGGCIRAVRIRSMPRGQTSIRSATQLARNMGKPFLVP